MTRVRSIRVASIGVLTALISVGHWLYSWWFSLRLYQWSGGIHKLPSGWTEFGGAHYAWAIPLELPGALMLRLCQLRTASDCNGTFLAQTSIVLLLLALSSQGFSFHPVWSGCLQVSVFRGVGGIGVRLSSLLASLGFQSEKILLQYFSTLSCIDPCHLTNR